MMKNTGENMNKEKLKAEQIIKYFKMRPIPIEGAYFTEGHRFNIFLEKSMLPEKYPNGRLIASNILLLITKDSFSRMHQLPTDEVYHFYLGDPVEQLQLLPDGTGKIIRYGHDILAGEKVQDVVPADAWHGTRLVEGGEWALMGTTMAPAWDDSDYTDGVRKYLTDKWSEFEAEIKERT
jgi:predicted cupin superfamily sugar epimerase